MHVNLSGMPDAPKVIAGMLRAIRWTMAEQNQATVGEIRRYNRGKGPFDVSEHRLGVRTNRWRNSIRATVPRIVGTAVVASIGSNVEYAGAHEFGANIRRKVKAGSVRLRTDAKGGLLSSGAFRGAARFAKASHKRFTTRQWMGGKRYEVNIPARAPITYGIEQRKSQYEKAMSASIINTLRGLEKIDIEEPTKEQVKKILLGIKPRMEEYHKCRIEESAIDATINLTARYLPARHFPDKAIDCIDTACAKFAWKELSPDNSITAADIANVVSKQCQVPIEVIMWTNSERIKNIENVLFSRVIGEDHAIKSICRTLKNAYSGVRNPSKPIGIFVFGGPSGTGKTYVAKELAKILFNNENSFIRIDMTEFSEPHSVSKITGSPPGYVGHNEGDVIADKIRRKPYCVLLLDEIEKAHPDVMKLFLQIMADGTFTDACGNKINCNNILLIMTGNFGMNEKGKGGLGFGNNVTNSNIEKEQTRLIDFCKSNYGVEFINRIDEFIPFTNLNDESMTKIINLRLEEFLERISEKIVNISFSNNVIKGLLEMSKQEHGMNATIINRLISKYIEPITADALDALEGDGKDVIIDFKNEKFFIK